LGKQRTFLSSSAAGSSGEMKRQRSARFANEMEENFSCEHSNQFPFSPNRFDILVNGGGAIILQFQRSPFRPVTRTVFVPWNQIIVLPPIQMNLVDEADSKMPKVGPSIAFSFLNSLQYKFIDGNANESSVICPDHNHELLRPILTSTWMPNAVGSMTGRSAIFAENQVSASS
jgi:teneurin